MRYLVVGASAGIGRALASRLAAAGHDLILVSSDERDVTATASDLVIRYGRDVVPLTADVADMADYLARLTTVVETVGGVDGLFFPAGAVLDEDDGTLCPSKANWLVSVNFTSVVATVTTLLPSLASRPSCIVGFGSIAAARGRDRNVAYGAAKRALGSYFESLRHRCTGSQVTVQFYVLGYIDTALSFGRRTLFLPADPQVLAERIVRGLGRDVGVVYYPRFWRIICALLVALPWPVFRRLRF